MRIDQKNESKIEEVKDNNRLSNVSISKDK